MKTIGILGGMSAASSQLYYKTLCDLTHQQFGGLEQPEILLRSVNFAPLAAYMNAGKWDEIAQILHKEAKKLQDGGADFIIIATNTMHKLFDDISKGIDIPFVHIGEATANALNHAGKKSPVFLATKFTMDEAFYLDTLQRQGINAILPEVDVRETLNQIIFDELCQNIVTEESQDFYINTVKKLTKQGADSVILGCTEIGLLLNENNSPLPIFDTTIIHCEAALNFALS